MAIVYMMYISDIGKSREKGCSRKRKNWAVTTLDRITPTTVPRIKEAIITLYYS